MPETLIQEILKLSAEERMDIANRIWDSIDTEAGLIAPEEILPGQKAELLRRMEHGEAHPESMIPMEAALEYMRTGKKR